MRLIDITRNIQDAPIYGDSEPVEITKISDMSRGDTYDCSVIKADVHMGTHADAFSHYLADSDVTVDKMPLQNYCGKCRVISLQCEELIGADDLRGKIDGSSRIVLHTGGNAYLCEEAAEYIASLGVKLLVTDAVSVGPSDNEQYIHAVLFAAGVAVVENAVLDEVEDGEYLIFAFPAKYGGCDGAPVRAVLVQGDE